MRIIAALQLSRIVIENGVSLFMSIRQRITLLVILTFIAISSIGGYAVYQSRNNSSEVKFVTTGVVQSALATSDLVSQLKDVQLATMAIVTAPDLNIASQEKDRLAVKKTLLLDALNLQAERADSDAQRGLVEQANESLNNYFEAINETVIKKLEGQAEIAQALFFGNVVQYQVELGQIVETLRVEKNRSKDNAISTLNENMATTTTTISIVTVIAVIFLSLVGGLLYRQIIDPISRMQKMMSEIAFSQDFTQRVPVDTMDEIGHSIIAFNGMIEKIEESSVQIKQKNVDIQTMLQNIPQGILTVTQGNKVHPEYSAYLESIFETENIVGRDFMDLVFAKTNLGTDIISQLEAVSGACIGEDVMNFEFNRHLLVGEVQMKMNDGRVKILDLNWSPITDDAGTTLRLMLCVRDVTELRKLAAEANEQKRELETIGEILSVNQEKFHEFIISSIKLIDENELIIRQYAESDADAIAKLFRNMHTVKGNGRTFGLQHLTNVVHEVEQSYDELRKPHSNIAWDQRMLMDELARVRAAVDRYARINEVSLGRKGPGRRGNADRYLMVDKHQIQETLTRLETVNTGNLHELISVRDAVRKTLRQLGTERIGEMLSSVLESMPSLAIELGKEVPVIKIEENGYVIHNQASGLLKNVFMHLIRNAMDHGLEAADVRSMKGKPAAGMIDLRLDVSDGKFQIALSDDGNGLALGRIRRVAIEKRLINADAEISDEEVARLIFLPAFSTAEQVTEVSGRGVGMDAVQDFIKRENGNIEIKFIDNAIGADFRQFKITIFLPESIAVNIGAGDQHFTDIRGAKPTAMGIQQSHEGSERDPNSAGFAIA